MTRETTTKLTPERVLQEAKRFFSGDGSVFAAYPIEEGDRYVTFGTFRGQISVFADVDPEIEGRTRVRASTLREDDAVGKFITYLRSFPAARRPAASRASGG